MFLRTIGGLETRWIPAVALVLVVGATIAAFAAEPDPALAPSPIDLVDELLGDRGASAPWQQRMENVSPLGAGTIRRPAGWGAYAATSRGRRPS